MAGDTVVPITKIVISEITKGIGYAVSSRKHVNRMNSEMEHLKDISATVRRHVDDYILNDSEIPPDVFDWLEDVERLNEEFQSITREATGSLNMKMSYRTGRKAFKIAEMIEKLVESNSHFKWTNAPKPMGRVGAPVLSSRDRSFNDALKFLQQDYNNSQVIALYGIDGVGKTTMMEQLRKVAQELKMFDWIVKVNIGINPNILSIQDDIAVQIGSERLPEVSVTARASCLFKKFKTILEDRKRKILVILDDVWLNFELKDIGLTSPMANGVKLLLTSRIEPPGERIAHQSGSDLMLVKVDALEEEEAYNLLNQITGISKEEDHEMYLMRCDIVQKCRGLPIAIKQICTILRNQNISERRNVLRRLNRSDIDGILLEINRINYEYIRQGEDKEIFLLCVLFPENFDIPIEDLTRHAWGLELFEQVSSLGEARGRTMKCVKNLINANLLILSHDLGHVKMPNLVHAFVLSTVSKENHPWVINHSHGFNLGGDEMRERCKRISLTCTGMSEFPPDFRYPNLSLIQLMNGDLSLKFQGDFYDHMENLQVIAYYNMRYPLLPRSLKNLKTLSLHKCTLMADYSFLGDFVNLEVLSLAGCHVRRLPVEIGNLRKLKLLDLTGCDDLLIDDGVFVNLKNLEELYMRVSGGKAIRFTNANFEELKMLSRQLFALEVEFVEKETLLKGVSFKKLDKFKITVGCSLEKEKDTDKYLFKRTLKIVTESSSDLRDWKIGELFNKTEKLHLHVEDMIQLQDVSHAPYQKLLFLNLRDLEVCNCVELKYLFPLSVASGLRKLERLTVSSCFGLQALVHENEEEINNVDEKIEFKKLRFLSLVKLPGLVNLFPVHSVVELPQLVELEVDGLPNFTSIYPGKNSISPLLNSQGGIIELKKLRIKSMNSLKQIWAVSSEEEVNDNSMLKEIKVEGCDSLVNLFPTNPMRLLRHLEELRVWNCGSLEVIFNIDLRVSNRVTVSNSSLRVIEVHGLKNVREVWRIQGGESNSNSKISFAGVESISIKECNMFRSVITPTNANIYMRALAKISIYDCGRGRNKEPEINVASLSSLRLPRFTSKISDLNLGRSPLKVLFQISNETTQEQDALQLTTLISNLKNLRLSHMARMTHVWKGGNSLILLNQSSFNNLTTIYLYQCKKIKYLFSPLMAKLFCNLQKIHLDACDAMEQVVSNQDEKITTSTSTFTATFFPKFHSLILHFLTSLKGIGGTGGVHDKFKFSQVNVSVVCSSLFRNSREIQISWCDGLSEIFETQGINNNSRSNSSFYNDEGNGAIHNTSSAFPKLLNINVPQLSNLTKLVITNCGLLQHVFTFSTLESLKQLQELQIQECEAIKVIVKEENEEQKKVVEFPCLISLKLSDLQNLKGFFLGMNSFNWPSLETVMFSKCPQMVAFTNSQSITPNLKYIHTSLGKHSHLTTNSHQTLLLSSGSTSLARLPWSFHNLIELHMQSNYDPNVKCIIPFKGLPQLQMLKKIKLDWCFHVNEVFEIEIIEEANSFEIPKLRDVELSNLEDLKYIWKGGKHVLLFPNLTTISIDHCENLEHVFTSSMIGHLQKLQYLHISTCSNMKVIIMEENDIEVKDIVVLPSLKFLELEELQSLEDFWKGKDNFSWPFLHTLKIKDCPKMKKFSDSIKRI